jgi:hypothetical protein
MSSGRGTLEVLEGGRASGFLPREVEEKTEGENALAPRLSDSPFMQFLLILVLLFRVDRDLREEVVGRSDVAKTLFERRESIRHCREGEEGEEGQTTMASFNPLRVNSSRSMIRSSRSFGVFVKALTRAIPAVLHSQIPASSTSPSSRPSLVSSSECSGSLMLSTRNSKRNFSLWAIRASEKAERTREWPSSDERTQMAARTSATRARSFEEGM